MAINPNGVSVPAQSKDLDTTRVTTTYGLVHRQVITIADPETPTSYVTLTGSSLNVNITTASIAVTAASLPLPTGAATSALQTTGNTSLSTIITNTTGVSTAANQTTGNASLSTIATNTTGLNSLTKNTGIVDANTIRVSPATDVTQAISAVSLPLPTGAATSALQTTGNSSLSSIDTKTPALVTGRVPVDGSAVTQPISAAGLPLPSGASTSALQTTGNSSLSSIDGKITAVNTGAVVVSSSALPTGAATQTTLASIDAKFSALGQNTMAGSTPVVLASNHSDIYVKDQSSSYANITTTGTTTIKSGAGILRRLVINTKGSASNTFTIYDSLTGSGTVIATIDMVNSVSSYFEYGLAFTALTIVSATGTSANATVIYE